MKYLLITAVNWFAEIIIIMLLARAVLSWFVTGPYTSLYKVYAVLCNLTEPIVKPCRNFTMRFNTGMLDLSVFLAFFLVSIVRKLVVMLLWVIL